MALRDFGRDMCFVTNVKLHDFLSVKQLLEARRVSLFTYASNALNSRDPLNSFKNNLDQYSQFMNSIKYDRYIHVCREFMMKLRWHHAILTSAEI